MCSELSRQHSYCVKGGSPPLGSITPPPQGPGEVSATGVSGHMDTWAADGCLILLSRSTHTARMAQPSITRDVRVMSCFQRPADVSASSSTSRRSGTCVHHSVVSVAGVCCWLRCDGGEVLTVPCFANS